MLVPMNWLREFTPYECSAQELGERLTMRGLELEAILHPFAAIEGIIVGYVAQCVAHPDSDHLHCCKVDIGNDTILDIVCGAPNVDAGQKVAVAPVGCKLPDGTVIKKAKLRGQPSCGMICSERELGLSDDHSGIMILPDSTIVGHRLVDALYMDQEVLDLSITPNRGDCLSILGIARETAAAYSLPLHVPELPLIPDSHLPEMEVPVHIEQPDLCWLYTGRVISDLMVFPSPMRFRYRLLACGVRAVSNIVDVTNYVLMEVGQPLHSFDLDKVEGPEIFVRPAREGEVFVTLDGRERVLGAEDLCICDKSRAIGLAGVMGGLNTEIDANSKNVFLESAVFNPRNIRRTSRRLGLASEASYRFERGIDQQRTIWALNRAASLIASLGGGKARIGMSIAEPRPFKPAIIKYMPGYASRLLGVELTDSFQEQTLGSLGCAVDKTQAQSWTVIQPSWRHDLTRPADLVEEVGRVYGLDAIPPRMPTLQCQLPDDNGKLFEFQQAIKRWAAGLGLNEAVNYSFTSQQALDHLNLDAAKRVSIFNPLSEEHNVLRSMLAPGLLEDLQNNLAYGAQSLRMFEVANAFSVAKDSETGVHEEPALGLLLYGLRNEQRWPHKDEDVSYADLKGLLENLFNFLHLEKALYAQSDGHSFMTPCVCIELDGVKLGVMGRVKPELARLWNAQKDVWLAELLLEPLRKLSGQAVVKFKALPVFPKVQRDMTISAAPDIRIADILQKMLALKMPLLEGAVLLDAWQPETSTERNLTFRLTFRSPSRTLKDSEVDKEREKMAEYLQRELNVKI